MLSSLFGWLWRLLGYRAPAIDSHVEYEPPCSLNGGWVPRDEQETARLSREQRLRAAGISTLKTLREGGNANPAPRLGSP